MHANKKKTNISIFFSLSVYNLEEYGPDRQFYESELRRAEDDD